MIYSPWPIRVTLLSLGLLLQGCATVWPASAGMSATEHAAPSTRLALNVLHAAPALVPAE